MGEFKMLEHFTIYLNDKSKSSNTIESYVLHVKGFIKWFESSKNMPFTKLYDENVKEYVQHLKNENQKPSTINAKVNALSKFNEFLVTIGVQDTQFIKSDVFQKVQQQYASLAKVEKEDVEYFRQLVLESGNTRNYTIITLLAYAGLRISEALDLKLNDISIGTREITIQGKGNKQRTVLMNSKVKDALEKYLAERNSDSEYLFYSRQNGKLDRTMVNTIFRTFTGELTTRQKENGITFKKLDKAITPHDLRHFYCSYALEIGMNINEVANQAGHSSIQTTLLYTNPTKKQMLQKIDLM